MHLVASIAAAAVADPAAEEDSTVERILDAALEEFVLIGIRRATVGSVAQRAGVAPATIYRRIGQRDELIAAALARQTRRNLAQIADAIAPFDVVEDRIVEAFVAVLRIMIANPLMVRLKQLEPEALARQLTLDAAPLLALGHTFIRGEIERANTRGDTNVADPDALADILVRFTHSVLVTPPADIIEDETRARAYARAAIVPLVTT